MRQFVDEYIYPDAQAREEDGKRVSQEVIDKMTFVLLYWWQQRNSLTTTIHREVNLHAMRMGPGKHLKGLELMNGLVTPEEVRQSHTIIRILALIIPYSSTIFTK